MGGLGWGAGLPLEVGGDTSKTDAIYRSLRVAVGKGGSGPPDSIEDFWRQSKAQTIASVVTMTERAALQAFPDVATDRLPAYERLLRFGAPAGATDEERRRAIAAAWTTENLADGGSVAASLAHLSAAFSVETLPYEIGCLVAFGKMFFGRDELLSLLAAPPAFPNFADDFVVRIRWTLPGGETKPPATAWAAAADLANAVLPAWVDFELVTGDGFFCDGGPDGTSLLDLKTLGS
jgi:hypothetical protein